MSNYIFYYCYICGEEIKPEYHDEEERCPTCGNYNSFVGITREQKNEILNQMEEQIKDFGVRLDNQIP